MNYTKIKDNENRRLYKFTKPINKAVRGFDCEPTEYVIVSDAHTHTERLVFPVYLLKGYTEQDIINNTPKCLRVDYAHINGRMTMMIHGGDESTIRPDEEYLNELWEVNENEIPFSEPV